ncbi:MAG TPA: VCBS repeat-containing protein [Cyclobacteriaceae bacterium]|nr:VCBS repeat-containing protein [Cyclobacteriaceae bacterium]
MKIKIILFGLLLSACKQETPTLFTRLQADKTGVTFNNQLQEDNPELSIMNYPYFYNGGGVAVGDFNGDGLQDLVFTGNMVKNGLFINKGHFEFEDITEKSGIASAGGWCTGVTVADINSDGWQDIYICRSGLPTPESRKNLLFINNGDLTFKESAALYGLDDSGHSTQASFFDFDKDGDLDVFLINQSDPKFSRGNLDYIQNRFQKSDSALSNKLYRNDNDHFVDVSKQAGITSNIFTYSLGLSTSDLNQDGWPDIYVGNDFEEPDYMYINNGDGTFSDELAKRIDHTSLFSMGIDVADYNNDLQPDILQMDMLPEGNYAQKMHLAGDNYNRYNQQFLRGMFPQYMKNSLQKNNGDGTFSEYGQMAGLSNTDWSWSPLVADLDNDGKKDVFITNGYQRDNTDMQFVVYAMAQSQRIQNGEKAPSVQEYISHMPGIRLPNYVFKNKGDDHFENKVKDWGFDQPTVSQGAAYADLDNDGDLDLVINNTRESAGVYRNNCEQLLKHNFLKIKLEGAIKNKDAIGAKVYVYAQAEQLYVEQNPVRGYQSSVDRTLHVGLGVHQSVDSLRIVWPNKLSQLIKKVSVNQTLTLRMQEGARHKGSKAADQLVVEKPNFEFVHSEREVNDFARQFLLPHAFSHAGPCMASGDINGDGLMDVFVGGGYGQSGAIFVQGGDRTFRKSPTSYSENIQSKDTDAVLFDADGDHDLDLYVVSGGYEFEENSPLLQDRLYMNNGKGVFAKTTGLLEKNFSNKKCVKPVDFDGDGDLDLFVGGNVVPGGFPTAAPSKIYFNDGKGNFIKNKPANAQLGIVNDALWVDLDKDGRKDLIVVSEWMPLRVYLAQGSLFKDVSSKWFPFGSSGWWNCLAAGDFDNDGDIDLVAGNLGTNSQLKVDDNHPMKLFTADVDGNGSTDPIITYYHADESFPLALRDDLIGQVPSMKKKFMDYTQYAKAGINDILTKDQLAKAPVLTTNQLKTLYLENTGASFVPRELPVEAQAAPVFAIAVLDLNKDGNLDFILAGNNSKNRIYLGRDDANHGSVMLGDGKGNFHYLPQQKSGLNLRGDVRSLVTDGKSLLFGVNNAAVKAYLIK